MANAPPTPYSLKAVIDQDIVQEWVDAGYSLCFGKGVANLMGGVPASNVVTACFAPGKYPPEPAFEWKEEYAIAANSQTFKQGEVITKAGTQVYPVDLLAQNTLEVKDYSKDGTKLLKNDPRVAKGYFGFNPLTLKGAAIVYVSVPDKTNTFIPCFTDEVMFPPGPNNVEQFHPIPSAFIFLYKGVQTGSVVYGDQIYLGQITYPVGKTKATVSFNKETFLWDVTYV